MSPHSVIRNAYAAGLRLNDAAMPQLSVVRRSASKFTTRSVVPH